MDREIVAFIPARGGSKSIPLKNIKNFCGKPLIFWCLQAAVNCSKINKIYVSTDSDEIKNVVESFNFKNVLVISRLPETSTDFASTESVMLEFAGKHIFDDIVLIQLTSPLLETKDLDIALTKYIDSDFDSLLSVVRQKRFIWEEKDNIVKPVNYDPINRPRRQEWSGYFVENGAFYITSRKSFDLSKCRISGNIGIYEMNEETYFEIDEPEDWFIMEELKSKREIIKNIDISDCNLLITDIDGVLTDGGMYYDDGGDKFKKFNTKDGKAIELLKKIGYKVMFLTSEDSNIARKRGEKLKVDYCFIGVSDKDTFIKRFFLENKDFNYDKTVYFGDDINDLDVMKKCRYKACPKDAVSDIRNISNFISDKSGGEGCLRDMYEKIFKDNINVAKSSGD